MLDPRDTAMDADKLQQIQAHARAIAALLYDETAAEQLTTFEGIEAAIRGQILEYVSPEIGLFLSPQPAAPAAGEADNSKASWEKSPSPKSRRRHLKSKPAPN